MKNQALVTIPLTFTIYLTCHLPHLVLPSIPLRKHDQHWSPPLVLYADDMVTHQPNAFGTVLEFVLIAKKWDTPYILAWFFVEIDNASTLIYCTV